MEVAPKEIRALLGSTQQWMIGVGINVAVSIHFLQERYIQNG
jgi:hypothetical protein